MRVLNNKKLRPERRVSFAHVHVGLLLGINRLTEDRTHSFDFSQDFTVAAQWRDETSLPQSNVETHCMPAP